MKNSLFKAWVNAKYMEHKDECCLWKMQCKSFNRYVRRNKWWLKREYLKEKTSSI